MLERVLVIDENLNPRLARELRHRGRHSRAVEDLGLKGTPDPDLIRRVFELYPDPILVTGDDFMPAEHENALEAVGATVATVRPWRRQALTATWDGKRHRDPDGWEAEIVHRWAHSMQAQRKGSVRRYGLNGHAVWRRPRKRRGPSA